MLLLQLDGNIIIDNLSIFNHNHTIRLFGKMNGVGHKNYGFTLRM